LLTYDEVLEKCFCGQESPGKVLDFFIAKRVGMLFYDDVDGDDDLMLVVDDGRI